MTRALVQDGSTGADVLDANLRLNLAGANPQLAPSESFDATGAAAARAFQAAHGLSVDGQIGDDTWALLDQLDGGRLIGEADVPSVRAVRDQARQLLDAGDFAGAKALLDPIYADDRLPPEIRSPIAANLGWAEHGLANFSRALGLYIEQLSILTLFDVLPLLARDTIERIREVNLSLPPGALPSVVNRANLPPDG